MNNIEILKDLEKYISFANKQCNFSNDADYKWHKELAGMIENLIKENTELRIQISARETVVDELIKENKKLKEKQKEYEKQLDLDYVEENYIPKSKIKQKIEELENEFEYLGEDNKRVNKMTIETLQELLEGE